MGRAWAGSSFCRSGTERWAPDRLLLVDYKVHSPRVCLLRLNLFAQSTHPSHTSTLDEVSSIESDLLQHWSMRITLNALQASPAALFRRHHRVRALTRVTRSHATMTTGVFRVCTSTNTVKQIPLCSAPSCQPLLDTSRPRHAGRSHTLRHCRWQLCRPIPRYLAGQKV